MAQISETESRIARWWVRIGDVFRPGAPVGSRRRVFKVLLLTLCILIVPFLLVSWYWSREPKVLWVNENPTEGVRVAGFSTVDTLIRVTSTLLDKPGGYLTNDVMPPGVLLDNIPNWVRRVAQVRDLVRCCAETTAARNRSRSRT
jgi:hypothetical protein